MKEVNEKPLVISPEAVDNPFAAPKDRSAAAHSNHGDFELSNGGIVSCSGLTLPRICLVTQQVDALKTLPLRLVVPSSVGRWISVAGICSLIGGLAAFVLFFLLECNWAAGFSPLNIKWLLGGFFLLMSGLLLQGVSTFIPLLRPTAFIAASVSDKVEKAIRRQNRVNVLIVVVTVFVPAVLGPIVEGRGPLFMLAVCLPALLLISVIAIAINRKFHRGYPGLRIRAVSEVDGVFQVIGFTRPFLSALERHKAGLMELESAEVVIPVLTKTSTGDEQRSASESNTVPQ